MSGTSLNLEQQLSLGIVSWQDVDVSDVRLYLLSGEADKGYLDPRERPGLISGYDIEDKIGKSRWSALIHCLNGRSVRNKF